MRKLMECARPPRAVLRETGGDQVRAAQIFGINRNMLRKKLVEHGIDIDETTRG